MVRGRKPTPVALKLVSGNPGKRALPSPTKIPKRQAGRPKDAVAIPSTLDTAEKRIWRRIVKAAPFGVLTRADEEILTAYTYARRTFDIAVAKLKDDGHWREYGREIRAHPAIKVKNDASDRMAKLASDLGFSPTARARLGISDEREAEEIDKTAAKFFD